MRLLNIFTTMKKSLLFFTAFTSNYAIAQFGPPMYGTGADFRDLRTKIYTVDIKKTDGSTVKIQTRFNKKIFPMGKGFQFYLTQENEKAHDTILPDQTYSVIRNFEGKNIVGIPYDSLWLFPILEGKITCYSTFPEDKPQKEIEEYYIKKDESKIIKYSEYNKNKAFVEMIKDKPGAVKIYKSGGISKMIKAVEFYNNN